MKFCIIQCKKLSYRITLNSDSSFKYQQVSDDQDHGFRSRTGPHKPRKDFAFFIKPHIKCGQLISNRINNIRVTTLRDESEEFNGIVWSLPLTNKDYRRKRLSFSRTAGNCAARANLIRNNTTFRSKLPLHWRLGLDPLPQECHIASPRGFNHEGFVDALPFAYLGELFYNNSVTTIPRDRQDELFLFFSFEQSESIHLISSLGRGITQEDMQNLALSFNIDYEIQIQFKSDKHDDLTEKMFKLNARSWNEIAFNQIR